MKDFLYNLYQNDNFTLYLTIALVVLVVLFVIVLIFGKKDQKLEETKRLQKIELEGFKEENKELEKIEVPVKEGIPEPPIEEVALVEDNTEEVTVTTFEPEVKEEEPIVEEKDDTIVFMKDDKPLFEAVEDEVPLNIPDFGFDELESNLNSLEDIKKEFNDIELPTSEEVNVEEPVLTESKPNTEVFSSVFVNNSDIPTNNEEQKVSLFSIEDDEEDTIELPTLKVEKKEESVATLTDHEEEKPFSFDDISGETYDIK